MTASYQEWDVSRDLSPLVACVWAARIGDSGEPHVERVIPDGCIDLIYIEGSLIVAGPDTQAVALEAPARAEFAGLRFRPGVAPALLGVPASELLDQRVDAECVLGSHAQVLLDDIEAALSPRRRAAVLESHAQSWMQHHAPPDRLARAAVQRLRTGPHDRSVAALASELGVSQRQLHRRFVHALGYGPKMFERIARLQRFLACAADLQPSPATRTGVTRNRGLAELALGAGYADQPHLTRECRALTGLTPTALIGYPVTAS